MKGSKMTNTKRSQSEWQNREKKLAEEASLKAVLSDLSYGAAYRKGFMEGRLSGADEAFSERRSERKAFEAGLKESYLKGASEGASIKASEREPIWADMEGVNEALKDAYNEGVIEGAAHEAESKPKRMRILMRADDVPDGSTCTKRTGEKLYVKQSRLYIHREKGCDRRKPIEEDRTVFLISQDGNLNEISVNTMLMVDAPHHVIESIDKMWTDII
jgi:hypothetical protein